jgi:uncharacterized peroxidase-related enzyme
MSRLPLVDPAAETTRDLLTEVRQRLGAIPNMTRVMANSPAVLRGYLDLSAALRKGALSVATQELIALAVAQTNGCSYCLSAHSYLAERVARLPDEDISAARKATAADPKVAAILAFAVAVNDSRGAVTGRQLASVRAAGATAEEIAETIGNVAVNVLTNYVNKALDVDIDFPIVEA